MQPPIMLSARNRIIFCDPASHCYRQPVERWRSQMVKDETGSGWLNRVSTLSRLIFRLQLNEKQKLWQPNGTSKWPLSWSMYIIGIIPKLTSMWWSKRSLKSGGLLIIQGYTPKQLEYRTVGRNRLKIFIRGQSSNEPFSNFVYYRSWRR